MSFFNRLREVLGIAPRPAEVPPANLSPNWLRLPTLAPGSGPPFPIVGESSYQDALEVIAGGRNEEGTVTRWITAVLEAEPSNRYDRKAIRVAAGGSVIGYIPRRQTSLFHTILQQVPPPCLVRARLTGGWDRGPEDRGTIGVELSLDWPLTPMNASHPFLPAEKEVALTGEEHCEPVSVELGVPFVVHLQIAQSNPVRPKLPGPFVMALRETQLLGWLTPTMGPRYLPLIQEVLSSGLVPTARAVASEGRQCPQIKLLLPGTA